MTQRYPFVLRLLLLLATTGGSAFAAGTLSLEKLDLGDKYILTGPVAYFDLHNTSDQVLTIQSVTLSSTDGTFTLVLDPTFFPLDIQPGKFTPIGVKVNLTKEGPDSTDVTVVSNADNSPSVGTVRVYGRAVTIFTSIHDSSAHAFESFSIPVLVDTIIDGILDSTAEGYLPHSYIQHFTFRLEYNDTVLHLDTSRMRVVIGVDTQKTSDYGETVINEKRDYDPVRDTIRLYKEGDVYFHVLLKTGGIHLVGDTICLLTFQANQVLFADVSSIRTTFYPDTGYLFARFNSKNAVFTALPCESPTKIQIAAGGRLLDNHPNPFNPSTSIRFELNETGYANLAIYDRVGRLIRTLANGIMESGTHEIRLVADDLASGTYFCRLFTPLATDSRKITLSR